MINRAFKSNVFRNLNIKIISISWINITISIFMNKLVTIYNVSRPFTVGDIVKVGAVTGVVEKVGFRSTRIRTFDKSIVTVPNKNIISTELDNLGARPVRRVKFNIGLTYDTSVENIKNIVNDIQKLIDDHPLTNQDGRVRFLNFGASSLDIMVLYYVNSPDWEDLIDAQQKINYDIIDIVNKYNCEFAFPSTSVYIEKN